MATLSSTVTIKDLKTGQGGRGAEPPVPGGGGGDSSGGNGTPNYGERLRRVRLGMIIALTSITMVFVSLTSALVVRRGLPTFDDQTSRYVRDWLQVSLPFTLLMINTIVLLISSLTMELARRQITRQAALAPVRSIPGVSIGEERAFPWLAITAVLGTGFLVGQWMAWRELADRGFYLSTSASSSFVYLLTGVHAVHLIGGVLALLYAAAATMLFHKPVEARRIVVDATAWYWHFLAFLWIYIFALLEIAR
jgi:cytochrome c oxidase subunit 3